MKVDVLSGLIRPDETSWNGLLYRSANPFVFSTWQWQKEAFAPTPKNFVNVPVLP